MLYRLLHPLLRWLYRCWIALHGEATFKTVKSEHGNQTTVRIQSTSGYELNITVTRVIYTQHHRKNTVKKRHCIYRVRALASHDAPAALRLATEEEVSFPTLLPTIFSEEEQRRQVVRAYVQVITHRVQNLTA